MTCKLERGDSAAVQFMKLPSVALGSLYKFPKKAKSYQLKMLCTVFLAWGLARFLFERCLWGDRPVIESKTLRPHF